MRDQCKRLAVIGIAAMLLLAGCTAQELKSAAASRPLPSSNGQIAAASGSTVILGEDVSQAAASVNESVAALNTLINEGMKIGYPDLQYLWVRFSVEKGKLASTGKVLVAKESQFAAVQVQLSAALKTNAETERQWREQTITSDLTLRRQAGTIQEQLARLEGYHNQWIGDRTQRVVEWILGIWLVLEVGSIVLCAWNPLGMGAKVGNWLLDLLPVSGFAYKLIKPEAKL